MAMYGKSNKVECENSSSRGSSGIGVPQCYKAEATRQVTIVYNSYEQDVLRLCVACASAVAKDAKRHGYKVRNVKL